MTSIAVPEAGETRDEAFLRHVAGLLWPGGGADPASGSDSLVVLPSRRRPRVLVPAGARRAAVAALRSGTEQTSGRARARTVALTALFSAGLAELVFRDRLALPSAPAAGSVSAHLSAVLGRPLVVGLRLGPARANRKPVLQLLSPGGELVGFAKIGVNDLTNGLVAAEARALTRLATMDLAPVEVPRVLHLGQWRDLTVLVQSPLPVGLARDKNAAPLARAAVVTVAGAMGERAHPISASPYLHRLRGDLARLPEGSGRAVLRRGLEATAARPDRMFRFGCWHGDWTSGNMAVLADRVLVWDWERFDADVPLGIDALHHCLMELLTREGRPPPEAAGRLIERAPELLAPFGVPSGDADALVTLYLVELGARYLRDRQAQEGPAFGRIDNWLLPAVTGLAERLGAQV
jgi:hypothetical protein